MVNPTVAIVRPGSVQIEDRPVTEPGRGDVLVKALYSGISAGTEMNVYRGNAPHWRMRRNPATGLFSPSSEPDWSYPLVYGYATVGHVERIGEDVEGIAEGELVFSYAPHQLYSTVPATLVTPLGAPRDPKHGIFMANLNTALNGVLDARLTLGDVLVVMGLGVIGQLVAQLARRAGAEIIVTVDSVEERRELSLRLGADKTFEPDPSVAEAVRELSDGRGADVVIEVSGAPPALHEAVRTAGFNALVVVMSWYGGTFESLSLSGEFHHNRVRIHSSQSGYVNPELGTLWGPARRNQLALRMLDELELGALLTHEFPIHDAPEAYRAVDTQAEGLMQCVLTYPES